MDTLRKFSLLAILFISLLSCEEELETQKPCTVGRWASADKNAENVCLGQMAISYWSPNTSSAHIVFTAGSTSQVGVPEIEAEFTIPISGIALNTNYPLNSGKLAGADPFTEGYISFINFDYPECVSGTFELKAENSDIGVIQSYSNGKFVFDKQGQINSSCNPFN
ncbi:hypothetical protein GCM10027429_00990 [Marivirga atlantica]|uniref:Lipoprotein n=1 Tax=Marivirga atlantica TaxID=1548457 RepID=A0A937ABR8_9BACT|nr:hypothetical protein [Marivirga atlantica]MBL0763711.1 hypothetical protein [Marivirga atlantica]